jgi:hypothetical protein
MRKYLPNSLVDSVVSFNAAGFDSFIHNRCTSTSSRCTLHPCIFALTSRGLRLTQVWFRFRLEA